MIRDSRSAMDSSKAAMNQPRAPMGDAEPPHPPVILKRGPRDYAVLAWKRDEDGEAVYRIVQREIKAASSAGVIARKRLSEQERKR
jgi:hypothetical protein